ncbi:MAG TPA: phage portal protein [Nitrospira sp.]|nr:phage portal protein [Nitrospira sp.]
MAKASRLTGSWGNSTTSEDNELTTSLTMARNRSRSLVRDAAYAKRAKLIIQNNVIGSGINMQAKVKTTRGAFNDLINDDIEETFEEWCQASHCHMGRSLHFADLERQLIGQVFEAGEIFVRFHFTQLPESSIPLALEIIEPERVADQLQPSPGVSSATVRLGVEIDEFCAPLAYWFRTLHPGDLMPLRPQTVSRLERVPAEFIQHLRIIDRWPQTRAIPWMHTAARKLNDMDGLTEAEITAARAAACYMGIIETPAGDASFGEEQEDGSLQMELEPAVVQRLAAGEKFNSFSPNRPNAQLDPFMRMMLREVAAGVGCSYESLSRDYSQSNYSSSRLALLDDRDLWRVLQLWFIRSFRQRLHKIWLQQAVLAGAIQSINVQEYAANPRKFEAACFKPRGWSWVDPTKEVNAYKEAVRCGFTTNSAVIAATGDGRDLEDVLDEREAELEQMAEAGLQFDTDPNVPSAAKETAKNPADPALPTAPSADPSGDAGTDPTVQTAENMLKNVGGFHGGSR